MKEIQLTRGLVALVDDADFEWLSQWKWYAGEKKPGLFYARRQQRCSKVQQAIQMHRAIVDPPSHLLIDHIDGNPLNNQRANLRACTYSENARNRHKVAGESKYKGVQALPGGIWRASICLGGSPRIQKYLGSFVLPEDAARAYDKAALELFGEFAHINGL